MIFAKDFLGQVRRLLIARTRVQRHQYYSSTERALRVIQERKFIDTSNVLFAFDTLTFKTTVDLFDNPITYVPLGKKPLPMPCKRNVL